MILSRRPITNQRHQGIKPAFSGTNIQLHSPPIIPILSALFMLVPATMIVASVDSTPFSLLGAIKQIGCRLWSKEIYVVYH